MQMPAARQDVRQSRSAHEAYKIAVAAGDLFRRGAKQGHAIGSSQTHLCSESELALARAELELDRLQRQFERLYAAANGIERSLHLIEPTLGQILIARR